jgi:fumarate reductase subunit D
MALPASHPAHRIQHGIHDREIEFTSALE